VPAQLVIDGAQRFVDAEVAPLGLSAEPGPSAGGPGPGAGGAPRRSVAIAGIGTTAPKAVRGALLAEALADHGYSLAGATPHASPVELVADPEWQVAVVLSPWKRDVGAHCDRLAPSAEKTGVVDTILRTRGGLVGFNTNTWAAQSALEFLLGGTAPNNVLLLGSGASARSLALAVQRAWPECQVLVAARSLEGAQALAREFPGLVVHEQGSASLDVVVNTTTWGETEASEAAPMGIDLDGVFQPGRAFFDLNNRVGSLPLQALQAGCAVISGAVMQRVTNASRAALVAFASSRHSD
jgi:shikimate dehydrogenase